MRQHAKRSALSALALSILAAVAAGQTVHRLTPTGPQVFADLQPAIDAAVDGDVLLVAPGTYSPFVIDGKGLSIFALEGASFEVTRPVTGSGPAVAVRNLAADQRVVLSGMTTDYTTLVHVAVHVQDCRGICVLQECRIDLGGWIPWQGSSGFCQDGVPALLVERSFGAQLIDSELRGGAGESAFDLPGIFAAGEGAPALSATRADVTLAECELIGGDGGNAGHSSQWSGAGGPSLLLQHDSATFASGGLCRGGYGGSGPNAPGPGFGGFGAAVDTSSALHHLDLDLVPGESWSRPFFGDGLDHALPGKARSLTAPTVGSSTSYPDGTYEGLRGDRLWILASNDSGFRWFPFGVLQLEGPQALPGAPAVVPAGGLLATPFDLTATAPGVVVVQGFANLPNGARRLTGPRYLLTIDPASAPDCNGNGVNDYLDLVAGTSQDANANLVPDECPGG